jgi:hypothetical protein
MRALFFISGLRNRDQKCTVIIKEILFSHLSLRSSQFPDKDLPGPGSFKQPFAAVAEKGAFQQHGPELS